MPFGVPKTEEERRRAHQARFGTSSLPPRGTGLNMPYGIKGKTKKWEQKTEIGKEVSGRIEKCVSSIMADPKFKSQKGRTKKESAIAVCKSSITKSEEFKRQLA